jgi:hypothetical protein
MTDMADLRVDGNELVLHLTAAEKLEGVHGDLRAPLSAVRKVEILDDAHAPAGISAGMKIGTRLPGVIEVGAIFGKTQQLFAAVHHNTPRGLRITLDGTEYHQWIVGCPDPEGVAARLGLPTGV